MAHDIAQSFEIRAQLEGKTIRLTGNVDVQLVCDREWMTEAVSNLVKNALDHTREGGSVVIHWEWMPAVTRITVRDDGRGILQEDSYHIFKRFYRSRFAMDTRGLGLGLPLAKAIVEAHDGVIAVDSEPNQSTTFTMSFMNLTKQ